MVRRLYLTPEIHALMSGPWHSEDWEVRCSSLAATLEAFVRGLLISVSLVPYEHGDAFMGRLYAPADEVWDIRCRQSPGLRVFGRFLETDLFIATNFAPRSVPIDGILKTPLGDRKTSMEWDFCILNCQEEWARLFPSTPPVHGDQISDYLSNAIPGRDS
jgi:hypothetical protein